MEGDTATIELTYEGAIVGSATQQVDFRSDRAEGTISYDESSDESLGALRGLDGQTYVDGTATYMKFPEFQVPGWIELPQDPTGDTQNQPSRLFSTLDAALDDVTEKSSEPEGTTYEGVYDLNDLVEETAGSPEELETARQEIEAVGDDAARVPTTIVVGDDGRIAALTLDFYEGTANEISARMEVGRIGQPVDIGPPPRDYVSAEEFAAGATG